MENIYVFRVVKHVGDWGYELLQEDLVLFVCVQDVERYREYLVRKYENEWMVEINVSPIEDHLEPDDVVNQRLLSVM